MVGGSSQNNTESDNTTAEVSALTAEQPTFTQQMTGQQNNSLTDRVAQGHQSGVAIVATTTTPATGAASAPPGFSAAAAALALAPLPYALRATNSTFSSRDAASHIEAAPAPANNLEDDEHDNLQDDEHDNLQDDEHDNLEDDEHYNLEDDEHEDAEDTVPHNWNNTWEALQQHMGWKLGRDKEGRNVYIRKKGRGPDAAGSVKCKYWFDSPANVLTFLRKPDEHDGSDEDINDEEEDDDDSTSKGLEEEQVEEPTTTVPQTAQQQKVSIVLMGRRRACYKSLFNTSTSFARRQRNALRRPVVVICNMTT